jgi:hypothetical protein
MHGQVGEESVSKREHMSFLATGPSTWLLWTSVDPIPKS